MHHCNFRNASRHCISRHTRSLLGLTRSSSNLIITRLNGNTSVYTIHGNRDISASVKVAPLRNLVVNAHDNSISFNTVS